MAIASIPSDSLKTHTHKHTAHTIITLCASAFLLSELSKKRKKEKTQNYPILKVLFSEFCFFMHLKNNFKSREIKRQIQQQQQQISPKFSGGFVYSLLHCCIPLASHRLQLEKYVSLNVFPSLWGWLRLFGTLFLSFVHSFINSINIYLTEPNMCQVFY